MCAICTIGYEKRFARGIHHLGNRRMLGYDEVNGALTPNEDASVAEEELLRRISEALGWEWKGAEEFDAEQFLREVQAVHLENGAVSVQKWTQRMSA